MLNWFRFGHKAKDPFIQRILAGSIVVNSGCLWIVDPQYASERHYSHCPAFKLENAPLGKHPIYAQIIQYPEGGIRVAGLEILLSKGKAKPIEEIGSVGVDSGMVIIFDELTYRDCWQGEGPERIGVIASPKHRQIAKMIFENFGLKSKPINFIRSELLEPISGELETKITDFVKTTLDSSLPYMYFRVETKGTLEKILDAVSGADKWHDMVLDESSGANILAFSSGLGDGRYSVYGIKETDSFAQIGVEFIGPNQEKILESFPLLKG